jgi:hypothetical protein
MMTPSGRVWLPAKRGRLPAPDPAAVAARRATCHACDRYSPEADKCRDCGCSATVSILTASRFFICRNGFWNV